MSVISQQYDRTSWLEICQNNTVGLNPPGYHAVGIPPAGLTRRECLRPRRILVVTTETEKVPARMF